MLEFLFVTLKIAFFHHSPLSEYLQQKKNSRKNRFTQGNFHLIHANATHNNTHKINLLFTQRFYMNILRRDTEIEYLPMNFLYAADRSKY